LLFLTTTEARAFSFLKALQALLEKAARTGYYGRRGKRLLVCRRRLRARARA